MNVKIMTDSVEKFQACETLLKFLNDDATNKIKVVEYDSFFITVRMVIEGDRRSFYLPENFKIKGVGIAIRKDRIDGQEKRILEVSTSIDEEGVKHGSVIFAIESEGEVTVHMTSARTIDRK